jgi:hypothetical protein
MAREWTFMDGNGNNGVNGVGANRDLPLRDRDGHFDVCKSVVRERVNANHYSCVGRGLKTPPANILFCPLVPAHSSVFPAGDGVLLRSNL